ncbi:putative membrane protein [Kribbella sp. VKM Ac-2571]|uniref:DUF1345 domain-containing protein n=1 Tax=Kribbella sp. VKM Ac-2571 TaxID=2512222 RepID=UPI0010607E77|nr:DUF1345 domain-containing protein [Kribbella sp. VKM Ac-2571]TDO66848.1 putative membrane protein [Kribbella sp. VKM Ac-2571]
MAQPKSSDPWWVSTHSRTRLAVTLGAGLLAAVAIGLTAGWTYAPLAGWDLAALLFVVWVWLTIRRMDAAESGAHATREDPGRALTDLILLVAAVASLVAVGYLLLQASGADSVERNLIGGFAVASIAVSWFTVHTIYALRYARLYFVEEQGGVNFHQDAPPDYQDFTYLAFTIGMTFQVSDTELEASEIRHTALRHALLSYLFGAVILAGTVNLVAGLGTGG